MKSILMMNSPAIALILIVLIIMFALVIKIKDPVFREIMAYLALALVLISGIIYAMQYVYNVTPKAEIDRSRLNSTTKQYQQTVTQGAK